MTLPQHHDDRQRQQKSRRTAFIVILSEALAEPKDLAAKGRILRLRRKDSSTRLRLPQNDRFEGILRLIRQASPGKVAGGSVTRPYNGFANIPVGAIHESPAEPSGWKISCARNLFLETLFHFMDKCAIMGDNVSKKRGGSA